MTNEEWLKLLSEQGKPATIGSKIKTDKCGMCGAKVKKLYPRKVGSVDFMICENCKSIMDL